MTTSAFSENKALFEALALHGALLPVELRGLGITEELAAAHPEVIKRVETQIGPLYLPGEHRHVRDALGRQGTSRTVHAASDGAYVRLFMRRNPGHWVVPRYDYLGTMRTNSDEMARFVLPKGDMVVCGKWQGGGVSTRALKRYIVSQRLSLLHQERKLLVIAPSFSRYEHLATTYQDVLALSEYTLEDAFDDNITGK